MAKYEIHHRKPQSRGGDKSARNTVRLKQKYHKSWHRLFGRDAPNEIASLITKIYLDPDFYMVAIPRKKRRPKKKRVVYLRFKGKLINRHKVELCLA